MLKPRKNILMGVVMALCIVAQVAIIMPHHHHDNTSAACINPLHCVTAGDGAHDDGDDGCAGHQNHRHDEPGSDCTVSHIDIAVPVRDQDNVSVPATDILHGVLCHCSLLTGTLGQKRAETVSRIDLRRHTGAVPPHTGYIKRALPPRAPSV